MKFFQLPQFTDFAVERNERVLLIVTAVGSRDGILGLSLRIQVPAVLDGGGHTDLIGFIGQFLC